jgi:hypothetical protein
MRHDTDRVGRLTAGLIILGVGILFLLERLDIIPGIDTVWPVFPIIVGIALIVSAFYRGGRTDTYS